MRFLFSSKKDCQRLAHFIGSKAVAIVVVAVLVSLFAFHAAKSIRVDSNYLAFLPDSFPGAQSLKRLTQIRGGFGNFMLITEGGTLESRRAFVKDYIAEVKKLSWVEEAEVEKGWEKIKRNKLLFVGMEDLQEIHQRLDAAVKKKILDKNPLYISFLDEEDTVPLTFDDIERKYQATSFGTSYFEDPDLKYTLGLIWPHGSLVDMAFSRQAYADLQKLLHSFDDRIQKDGIVVDIGGEYRNKIDEYDSLLRNVMGSSLLTFIGITVLLVVFYRKPLSVLFIIIPLGLGSLWTLAAAQLIVGQLNLLTVFLVAILFGIGIDYGIFLFSSYSHFRQKGLKGGAALAEMYWDCGKPLGGAALTTALAFAILMAGDFRGFFEFGLLSSIGIFILLFTYLFVAPALWILAEQASLLSWKEKEKVSRWPLFLGNKMIVMAVVLAITGLALFPLIGFEYDYGKLRSLRNSYWKLDRIIHDVFPLSKTPAVILTESLDETRKVVSAIREKIPHWTTVDTVKSVLDILPEDTEGKKIEISAIKGLIDKYASHFSENEQKLLSKWKPYLNPDEIHVEDLPHSLLRQFHLQEQEHDYYFVLIYDKVRLSDAQNALKYADEIREIKADGKSYFPAEGSILFADALELMKRESGLAFLLMLVVVFAVLLWEFRSLPDALITLSPTLLGFLILFIFMFLFGLKLNIFNLVIFPILLGVADDGALHLFYHLKHLEPRETKQQGIARIARSLLVASLTTLFGFASLINTDHQGLRSLGILACLGILANLISCLVFFPAIVLKFLKK